MMQSRRGALAGSLILHAALVLLLFAIRFAAPAVPRHYESIYLSPPPAKPAPASGVRPRLAHVPRTFSAPVTPPVRLPMPAIPQPPRVPAIAPAIAAVETPPPLAPAPPAPSAYTTATLVVPPQRERPPETRTGTFSDAAASRPDDRGPSKVRVGSFDGAPGASPAGRPSGHGFASAAGFDATPPERAQERSRVLRASGFSDLAMAAAPATRRAHAASGVETALEILGKPRPVYSDAARRLGLEGDVVLEAEFPASGQVRVLRVIHGLGHGLDENAILAAGGIRFRPATINGAPVDTIATVRITFQIAN